MKKIDRDIGLVMVLVVAIVAGCSYVHYEKTVVTLDGVRFAYAGMARLPTTDEVYTPVYKRLK